jgi:hypothetical protein
MDIEAQIEAALVGPRREMALEGGSVRLVRLDGEVVLVELSGPRSISWTFAVTAAVQSRLPQLIVMTSLCATPRATDAGTCP